VLRCGHGESPNLHRAELSAVQPSGIANLRQPDVRCPNVWKLQRLCFVARAIGFQRITRDGIRNRCLPAAGCRAKSASGDNLGSKPDVLQSQHAARYDPKLDGPIWRYANAYVLSMISAFVVILLLADAVIFAGNCLAGDRKSAISILIAMTFLYLVWANV